MSWSGFFLYQKSLFIDSGLIAHFRFEDTTGGVVRDSSIKKIQGNVTASVTQGNFSEKCGNGVTFSNGSGFIALEGDQLNEEFANAMTIAVWVRLTRTNQVNVIYACKGDHGTHRLLVKSEDSPNAFVRWSFSSSGQTIFDESTDAVVPAGRSYLKHLKFNKICRAFYN